MKNKLEEIMDEISLFGFNNDRRIGTDVREIRKILEKHLQEPTEEREMECVVGDNCPNCNTYGDFFPTQKYCSYCGAKIKRVS